MRLKILFLGMCAAAALISCNNDVIDNGYTPVVKNGIVESTGAPSHFALALPKQTASTYAGDGSLTGIRDESTTTNAVVFIYKMDAAQNIFPENYAYIDGSYSNPVIMKTTDGTKKVFVALNIGPAMATFFGNPPIPGSTPPANYFDGSTTGGEGAPWVLPFNALQDSIWALASIATPGWSTVSPTGESSANGLIKAFAGGTSNYGRGLLRLNPTEVSAGTFPQGDRLYLMSNWDNGEIDRTNPVSTDYVSTCIFNFSPDVPPTALPSVTPSLPKNDPSNPDTSIIINVQRAIAKAALKITAPGHMDGFSYVSDGDDGDKGYFTPWEQNASTKGIFVAGNISKVSSVFQRFFNSSVSDLNYDSISCEPPANLKWYKHFDNIRVFGTGMKYRSTIPGNRLTVADARTAMTIGAQSGDPNAQRLGTDTLYLTENAQRYTSGYQDNSTFLTVGGKYNPRYWISNIVQAPVTTNPPITAYNGYTLGGSEASGTSHGNTSTYAYASITYSSSPASNDTLYYHIGKKLFFYGKDNLYKYYAWVDKKDTDTNGAPGSPVFNIGEGGNEFGPGTALNPMASADVAAAITADLASKTLVTYFQGNCWYRVFITDQNAAKPNEKVLVRRNHFYDVDIYKILGPGIADPNDIIIPGKPVLPADTYISVTINVQNWHKVTQQAEVTGE